MHRRAPTYTHQLSLLIPIATGTEHRSDLRATHAMASEIAHEFFPFRVYTDGRVERLRGTHTVPPSTDPHTGVRSKDTLVSPETPLSARLYLPPITHPKTKLPLLIYVHGGAFCIESPFSPLYQNFLSSLVHKANVLAVSIEYRLAPEHPLPAAYDDAWAATKWVASHVNSDGPEAWLNDHADFGRAFFAGDSAGANISHNTVMRSGMDPLSGMKISGMALIHPFFMNEERDELIEYIFPTSSGTGDPRMNPGCAAAELARLGCDKVAVFVAEKDWLRGRGVSYYEALKKSGWVGEVAMVETAGEDHVFHLFNPASGKALDLIERVAHFLKTGAVFR